MSYLEVLKYEFRYGFSTLGIYLTMWIPVILAARVLSRFIPIRPDREVQEQVFLTICLFVTGTVLLRVIVRAIDAPKKVTLKWHNELCAPKSIVIGLDFFLQLALSTLIGTVLALTYRIAYGAHEHLWELPLLTIPITAYGLPFFWIYGKQRVVRALVIAHLTIPIPAVLLMIFLKPMNQGILINSGACLVILAVCYIAALRFTKFGETVDC